RGAEGDHAELACPVEDGLVPLPWRLCLPVQLVERPACPETLRVADMELALVEVERHRVGGVSLDLEAVRARLRRRLDDLERAREGLVVIARHLGDDKRRVRSADGPIAESHGRFFHGFEPRFNSSSTLSSSRSEPIVRRASWPGSASTARWHPVSTRTVCIPCRLRFTKSLAGLSPT